MIPPNFFPRILCGLFFLGALSSVSPAQTLTTLHNFDGTDGWTPVSALVQAADGTFYGTTQAGGMPNYPCQHRDNGCGTVFKMTADGALTTLYNFCSLQNCADSVAPFWLVQSTTDGNFYGTTIGVGGYGPGCFIYSMLCGTVFRITPDGTLTTLYNFCSLPNCTDGTFPTGLIQAKDGNFYGTTFESGANGGGTVFRITPDGALTTLYNFCSQRNCADGSGPLANGALVIGKDENFYGATATGGEYDSGTIFKMTPTGVLTTLYSVTGSGDGLVQATDGNFYGITGGAGGSVFRMTPEGMLTTIGIVDGPPSAGLMQDSNGALYGMTSYGGDNTCSPPYGCGTIYQITLGGTLTNLLKFEGTNGAGPLDSLIQGTDGKLYGTTSVGGTGVGCGTYCPYGTVFSYDIGPQPGVSLSPNLLDFGAQGIDRMNIPLTSTLTNIGAGSLYITNISLGELLIQGICLEFDNCPIEPNSLAPDASCNITVVFSPTGVGTRNASVAITDNAVDSPQMISLAGIGVGGKVALR